MQRKFFEMKARTLPSDRGGTPSVFSLFEDVFSRINAVSGRNDKKGILKNALQGEHGETLKKFLLYTLDPTMHFNVRELPQTNDTDRRGSTEEIFEFLRALSDKRGCTGEEAATLAALTNYDRKTRRAIERLLQKDLDCGLGPKSVKQLIPELFLHEAMLCKGQPKTWDKDWEDFFRHCREDFSNIYDSIKFDGVRCWAVRGPWILDGEVTGVEKKFQKQMTQVHRVHDVDDSMFEFKIYDVVYDPNYDNGGRGVAYISRNGRTYNNFECFDEILRPLFDYLEDELGETFKHFWKEQTPVTFAYRYNILLDMEDHCCCKEGGDWSRIEIVEHRQGRFTSLKEIIEEVDRLVALGEEGLVLKAADSPYVYGRVAYWLKVKKFHTVELEVTGYSPGKKKNLGKVGALICNYNGVEVKVGSGLSDQEREDFLEKLPSVIEVRYQSETDEGSLRFPIFSFVCEREDKDVEDLDT